jgi:phage anti-repressor protein
MSQTISVGQDSQFDAHSLTLFLGIKVSYSNVILALIRSSY